MHRHKLGIVTGTWSINEYITNKPKVVKDLFMTSIYPIADRWLITEASPTSASNLEWFINTFMDKEKRAAEDAGFSIYEYCNKLVASTKPQDSDLLFFPLSLVVMRYRMLVLVLWELQNITILNILFVQFMRALSFRICITLKSYEELMGI